jgi:hypothetical protein
MSSLTHIAGEQPTKGTLAGPVHHATTALLEGTLHAVPASVRPHLGSEAMTQEKEEGRSLHRSAWIPPPLLGALDRTNGHAENVGEIRLADAELGAYRLKIDVPSWGHDGARRFEGAGERSGGSALVARAGIVSHCDSFVTLSLLRPGQEG